MRGFAHAQPNCFSLIEREGRQPAELSPVSYRVVEFRFAIISLLRRGPNGDPWVSKARSCGFESHPLGNAGQSCELFSDRLVFLENIESTAQKGEKVEFDTIPRSPSVFHVQSCQL